MCLEFSRGETECYENWNIILKRVLRCFFFNYYFYLYGCFAYMYVHVPYVYSAHGGHHKALDPLELVLLMVMSHHVGAGNQTCVFSINC